MKANTDSKSIWQQLAKPILILAPMEDVTDTVFRQLISELGKPDLFFTEFVNVDGLFSEGEEAVKHRLKYVGKEKPIIAQIWGLNPENYYKAGRYIHDLGFDGIDINMGCPVKKVIKQGACSALIKNHTLAKEIIEATLEGSCGLPVSIKTRIGFEKPDIDRWFSFLFSFNQVSAITVHGRTTYALSKTPADWNAIQRVVQLKNDLKSHTLVIGNGDIKSYDQAINYADRYNVDGVMIGRGIFQNPLIFNKDRDSFNNKSINYKLNTAIKHITLFQKTWGDAKNPSILKKFFKIYISGFKGASTLRKSLMTTNSYIEMIQTLQDFMKSLT